jgi:two-component system, sporulation sensor kinase D
MQNFNIYHIKQRWKIFIFLGSVIIGAGSLWYTSRLVNDLSNEEQKKIELWAEATKLIATSTPDPDLLNFLLKVTENNTTIPVILTDSAFHVIYHRNLRISNKDSAKFLYQTLEDLMATTVPIDIQLDGSGENYLFYDDSYTLKRLARYPYVQLSIILIFIIVSYLAFSASRKAEQNKVWVGLSRETAHQLGTPTSSLMAWVELLKEKYEDSTLINELEHDVNRLRIITERFSHIGSKPVLVAMDLSDVVAKAVDYMRTRISSSVKLTYVAKGSFYANVNINLFNWVIENLIKNAVDAIENMGTIEVKLSLEGKNIVLDIKDSGKGIPRKHFKRVFKPGFTTKTRGWGLGLSLARRIVNEYHRGKVFVFQSELHKGTTFRVILRQA